MFGLKDSEIESICDVLRRYSGIVSARIYGSRARGTHKPYSDIDIAVSGDIDFQDSFRLHEDMDDLLMPYKIDVTVYNKVQNAALIDHINREGKDLYIKEQKNDHQ